MLELCSRIFCRNKTACKINNYSYSSDCHEMWPLILWLLIRVTPEGKSGFSG